MYLQAQPLLTVDHHRRIGHGKGLDVPLRARVAGRLADGKVVEVVRAFVQTQDVAQTLDALGGGFVGLAGADVGFFEGLQGRLEGRLGGIFGGVGGWDWC